MAARESAAAFSLERVLFVPTGQPWQKDDYSAPEDRFTMVVLATLDDPLLAVSRIELDRSGPTYTVDTLDALRVFYGDEVLFFFILGADAALNLGTWVGLDRLAALTDIVAVERPGIDLAGLRGGEGWPVIHRLDVEGLDVSSTALREGLRRGEDPGPHVPAPVTAYIEARTLYGGSD